MHASAPLVVEVAAPGPHGPGRLTLSLPPDAPRAVVLLGHGAGGGIDALDLAALAGGLPASGIAVARYEQPWRVAGRRVAGPPASLDAAWRPAVAVVAARFPGTPLVVGGRSAGARVACRTFAPPAVGVVALSYPLHPPGRPEKSRAAELADVPAPVLLVSGDRDPFGSPDELRAAVASGQRGERELVLVPGSAHTFTEPRSGTGTPTGDAVVAAVASFVAHLA
nr:hydrolase [Propionibacterium sp.]